MKSKAFSTSLTNRFRDKSSIANKLCRWNITVIRFLHRNVKSCTTHSVQLEPTPKHSTTELPHSVLPSHTHSVQQSTNGSPLNVLGQNKHPVSAAIHRNNWRKSTTCISVLNIHLHSQQRPVLPYNAQSHTNEHIQHAHAHVSYTFRKNMKILHSMTTALCQRSTNDDRCSLWNRQMYYGQVTDLYLYRRLRLRRRRHITLLHRCKTNERVRLSACNLFLWAECYMDSQYSRFMSSLIHADTCHVALRCHVTT